MRADPNKRIPAGSLPREPAAKPASAPQGASGIAVEPVQDSAEAGAASRELVVVNPKRTAPKAQPSRYADALFLAHVFASKFDAPQQREKRRADPADANASYRKSEKRPAKLGRVLSKKI